MLKPRMLSIAIVCILLLSVPVETFRRVRMENQIQTAKKLHCDCYELSGFDNCRELATSLEMVLGVNVEVSPEAEQIKLDSEFNCSGDCRLGRHLRLFLISNRGNRLIYEVENETITIKLATIKDEPWQPIQVFSFGR